MPRHPIANLISDLVTEWVKNTETLVIARVVMPDMPTTDMRTQFRKYTTELATEVEKALFDYTVEEMKAHPKWEDPKNTKTYNLDEFLKTSWTKDL